MGKNSGPSAVWKKGPFRRRSVDGHAAVAQQGVDFRTAAAEGDEVFHRIAAGAASEDFPSEACAGLGIEHARLLKGGERVGGEDFGPLVAVVACGIAAGKDVGEALREAVVVGREAHGNLSAHVLQKVLNVIRVGIEARVQEHVEECKLDLSHACHAGLEVLGGEHLFKK